MNNVSRLFCFGKQVGDGGSVACESQHYFFVFLQNVASERRSALHPTLLILWEWPRALVRSGTERASNCDVGCLVETMKKVRRPLRGRRSWKWTRAPHSDEGEVTLVVKPVGYCNCLLVLTPGHLV